MRPDDRVRVLQWSALLWFLLAIAFGKTAGAAEAAEVFDIHDRLIVAIIGFPFLEASMTMQFPFSYELRCGTDQHSDWRDGSSYRSASGTRPSQS